MCLIANLERRVFIPIKAAQHTRLGFLITPTAFRADQLTFRVKLRKPMAMATHPPSLDSRNTQHERVVWNIAAENCSGPDECVAANCCAADDSRVGPNRGPTSDQSALVKIVPSDLGAGIDHIRENTGGTAKHIIFEYHA